MLHSIVLYSTTGFFSFGKKKSYGKRRRRKNPLHGPPADENGLSVLKGKERGSGNQL